MKFRRLAEYFEKIEKTASRLEMTEILAQMLKEAQTEEVDQMVYLALGMLRPKYEGIEFNLAEKMMIRVLSTAYGVELKKVEQEFKKVGDLGEIVGGMRPLKSDKDNQSLNGIHHSEIGKDMSVGEVYNRLFEIAVDEGQGSQDRKVQNMARLLKDLDLPGAKFAARIPVNKLRLGFSNMTILDALSWMEKGDKSLRPDLERAFNVSADIGRIAAIFKKEGLKGIGGVKVKIGVPIRAAQAERLPSAEKIVDKLEIFAVEGKWDGLRVQIHFDKGRSRTAATQEALFSSGGKSFVRIFSRNLDNITNMFPEISQAVEQLAVNSIILDGEAVGYDAKTGKLLPFQETIQRKRKHGVGSMSETVPIKVFVYDILALNGENLITKPFRERRKLLEKILHSGGVLQLADQEIVSEAKRLTELRQHYLDLGLEGVMCKKLTTAYQAGSRNFNWVKFKKSAGGELMDTIDAVVMGYYQGKGKRSGFGMGAFLVGVTDEKNCVGSIAKIGTGLTDEQWRELVVKCKKLETKEKPAEYLVDKNLECDVWVKPEIVVEIMADEITVSPIHAFGLALRFPRLINFREDKGVSEATGKKELERLFKLQKTA